MASNRLSILLKALSGGQFSVEELSSNLYGGRRVKVLKRYVFTSNIFIIFIFAGLFTLF